jgi:hypothetical protein
MFTPVEFEWTDDGTMRPLPRFAKTCDKQFVVGERYNLEVIEERSSATHRHYFACVHDAWLNLPHEIAERFPNQERLRRWALIKTGFANEQSMVCETVVDAARFASMLGRMNEDAVVVCRGRTIKIFTAKSQSMRSMDKAEFAASKTAVLDLLAEMVGTSSAELQASAGQAA